MFKKLLSNLPFNPSLMGQVSFYLKRLRQEQAIRRAGFIVLGLVFLVQLFAFISPPQPTVANSNNDIINGGFATRDQAILHCLNASGEDFYQILSYYGITCEDIAAANTVQLNSRDYDSQLYSMGRLPYGKDGETPVSVNGQTFWLRYLWSWDTYGSSTYTALQGQTKYGQTFFILFDCGNLVFIGLPQPPARCQFNPNILAADPNCAEPKCRYDPSISANDPRCKPCQFNDSITEDNPKCKPCEDSQTRDDKTACLKLKKSASNQTQNIQDANGTMAQPGDIITYILSVTNEGKVEVNDFIIQENLSDVLDYADTVDLDGGTIDDKHIVKWPAADIKPNSTITRKITVRVKNPLPQTPASTSDPGHFDLIMTNVYGNTISIKLPGSPPKKIETVATTLPNTGPGESIAIAFGIAAIAGFFFARTRLMAKEIGIVRAEYIHNGGPS